MMRFIVFGMFLGGLLGLISSSLDIVIWNFMGRPDVLIRPGWEEIGIVVMIISGMFVGFLYGLILNVTIRSEDLKTNASFIFFMTVFVAFVIYTAADFFSIKLFNIWPWFCAHVNIFDLTCYCQPPFTAFSNNEDEGAPKWLNSDYLNLCQLTKLLAITRLRRMSFSAVLARHKDEPSLP